MIRAATALALLLAAAPALAQGSLLDQGRGLLGTLGQPRPSTGTPAAAGAGLSQADIGAGLKEALKVGSERTVATLARPDGFNRSPDVHIPLPGVLHQAQAALKLAGMSGLADDLELRMNRAAEAAAPKARDIFVAAIGRLTIADAQSILRGPNDAATQYFRRETTQPLTAAMKPIVTSSLDQVGAVKSLGALTGQYRSLPLGSALQVDLPGYVTEKALDGLFLYLGREEAAIRANPAQRSTELLRRVFGG